MASPCPRFSPQERPSRPLFGIRFSPASTQELVKAITTAPANAGPRILVTANLDHVVQLGQNEDFRRAYRRAWVATADGMPVIMYAKLKRAGLPARVTGADLFQAVMAALSPGRHRCFFVASTAETARRLVDYLLARGFKREAIAVAIPPFQFDNDEDFSGALARRIARHGTTHLFMGVGAPKSEIWTDRYRDSIGNCYVLNCGAALDFFAGTKKRAPLVMRRAGLEWLWRLAQEPQRLYRRYFVYSWRFLGEVAKDLATARSVTTKELVEAPANAGSRILAIGRRQILGVHVSVFTRQSALKFVVESLSQRRKLCVAFANHNLLLELIRHPSGPDLLREFLVLNDGLGLDLASRLLYGTRFPENLNGTDFMPLLLRNVPVGTRVFLFGARPHVAEAAANVIERDYNVCVCGVVDGYVSDHAVVASAINRSRADVVLVGLGNPKQEEWIANFSSQVDAPLFVGIGAFFDFCAGAVRRAPKPIQSARLEWAFRLCLEPRRLGRRYTWDAVMFFVDVLQQKLRPSLAHL